MDLAASVNIHWRALGCQLAKKYCWGVSSVKTGCPDDG